MRVHVFGRRGWVLIIYALSAAFDLWPALVVAFLWYEKCFKNKAQTSQLCGGIDTATAVRMVWTCPSRGGSLGSGGEASRWKTHRCAQRRRRRREEREEPRQRAKGQTSDIDNRETQGTQHLTESDGR